MPVGVEDSTIQTLQPTNPEISLPPVEYDSKNISEVDHVTLIVSKSRLVTESVELQLEQRSGSMT